VADSLVSGAQALVLAVIDILKNYWAAELTTICTDLGITLSAPNTTHGYSASRLLPRNTSPSCEVFVDDSAFDPARLIVAAAPRRTITTLRVRIRWAPTIPTNAERDAQAYEVSACRAIMRWWRAYHSATTHKMRAVDVECSADAAASSLRARGQAEGLTDYGRGYEATDEVIELIVRCDHFVNAPLDFTIPTP